MRLRNRHLIKIEVNKLIKIKFVKLNDNRLK